MFAGEMRLPETCLFIGTPTTNDDGLQVAA